MKSPQSVIAAAILESDIRDLCAKAIDAQACESPDFGELSSVVVALRDCARRARAIGMETWESEVLEMATVIEWRCSSERAQLA